MAPGVVILIDTNRLKEPDPYFIPIDGRRVYGRSPEAVVRSIQGDEKVIKYSPKDEGTPGVGVFIDPTVLKSDDSSKPYYIVANGRRIYGRTPEDTLKGRRVKGPVANILSRIITRKNRAPNAANTSVRALSEGLGILIDTNKLTEPEPYFVSIDGKRVYGRSPEAVIRSIQADGGVIDRSETAPGAGAGVGVFIDPTVLKSDDSFAPYYIVANGRRIYGRTPEDILKTAKNGSRKSGPGGNTRKAGASGKRFGAIGSAAGRGFRVLGSRILKAVSSVKSRFKRTPKSSPVNPSRPRTRAEMNAQTALRKERESAAQAAAAAAGRPASSLRKFILPPRSRVAGLTPAAR